MSIVKEYTTVAISDIKMTQPHMRQLHFQLMQAMIDCGTGTPLSSLALDPSIKADLELIPLPDQKTLMMRDTVIADKSDNDFLLYKIGSLVVYLEMLHQLTTLSTINSIKEAGFADNIGSLSTIDSMTADSAIRLLDNIGYSIPLMKATFEQMLQYSSSIGAVALLSRHTAVAAHLYPLLKACADTGKDFDLKTAFPSNPPIH